MLPILFPTGKYCYLCGARSGKIKDSFCLACRRAFFSPAARCLVCRRFLSGTPDDGSRPPGGRCPACLVLGPPYMGLTSLGFYTGPLGWAVKRFKGQGELWLGRALGHGLGEALLRDGVRVDWIVPIPPEPRRLRRRGFNPPGLLAQAVGRRLRRPVGLWLRRRPGPPQARLTQRDRWRRAGEVYEATFANPPPGARVLLVDDVVTTGATLAAAAHLLLAQGAALVWCATAADAPRWPQSPQFLAENT